MFCPVCHSEYRRGIEMCATCEVALVRELAHSTVRVAAAQPVAAPVEGHDPLVEHCGFLSLEDARAARATLRDEGIRSEIVIRDAAGAGGSAHAEEEFWLRVPASQRAAVEELLGEPEDAQEPEDLEDAVVACSDCGKPVAEDAAACPHCGAQFE